MQIDGKKDKNEGGEHIQIDGKVDLCEALLRQRVAKKQLVAAGFPESTVRKAMKRLEKQGVDVAHNHAKSSNGSADSNHSAIDEADPHFPTKLSTKEMIPPEVILSGIRLQDGEYKLGFIDGLKVLMAAQWMVSHQVGILQSMASAQSEITESQLKILRQASSEGGEMATQAAQEAAMAVAKYFEENKPWLQANSNPMLSMMADLMKPVIQNVLSKFIPGFQVGQVEQGGAGFSPPPGFTYKEEKESD
jgi:hypothetical protein